MPDPAAYRTRLRDRLLELTGRMIRIGERLEERPDADPEERAVEREDDEVLERLGSAAQAEVAMIEAALERIERGTFGQCLTCGEAISAGRLDLVPHAAQCRHCARAG